MAIYLPSSAEEEQLALDELTPREIVAELDKHVIGQKDAKRAVSIALRNRMRRQKLTPELAEEIIPKNIIMIGPTGVGKSFVACALAQKACRDGYSALHTRAAALFRDLAMARADGSLPSLLARLRKVGP